MRWIAIRLAPPEQQPASGKTRVWHVAARDTGAVLGVVRWYGSWRQYVFFAKAETLYEPTCLRDIAFFTEAITRAHRVAVARRRAA